MTDEVVESDVESDVVVDDSTASLEQVALEVIAGRWGRGNKRKQRLLDAGFNPVAVKNAVDAIFGR